MNRAMNKDTKQLLEAAARAVGIDLEFDVFGPFIKNGLRGIYWNPIKSAGDRAK